MSAINEFKLTGAGYIAKNGDSANAGTDPLLPKSSPSDAGMPSENIIVGSGYYRGGGIANRNFFGDGFVVFDFDGNNINQGTATGTQSNIFFKNGIGYTNRKTYNNCIFQNFLGSRLSLSYRVTMINCIFLPPTPYESLSSSFGSIQNSIILETINSNSISEGCTYSFLSRNKKIIIHSSSGFANNCANGLLNFQGIDYELKFLADGTPRPDANPEIPDLAEVFPDTYTTRGNFAGDPKFLDLIGRIVEPDSDLLKRSNANGFIGGVKPGRITQARNNNDPNTDITLFNVVEAGNGYMVEPGQPWGKITIVTRESSSVVELGVKAPITPLNFDSAVTPGTALNNNVPDSWPLTDPGGNPGKLPNRLTYLLRTSQRNQKPTQDSHWDNDAAAGGVAGNYYVQEWFTKPTLTQLLGNTYGNAEPEGYGGTVNAINARWSEYTIYLRNDRNF
jgi:hypothetical protein